MYKKYLLGAVLHAAPVQVQSVAVDRGDNIYEANGLLHQNMTSILRIYFKSFKKDARTFCRWLELLLAPGIRDVIRASSSPDSVLLTVSVCSQI